jgi:hypothetical protein
VTISLRSLGREFHGVGASKRGNERTLKRATFAESGDFDTQLPELAMQHVIFAVAQMHAGANQQLHVSACPAEAKYIQQSERRPDVSSSYASHECRNSLLQSTDDASGDKRTFYRPAAQVVSVDRRVRDSRIDNLVCEYGHVMSALNHPDNVCQDKRFRD